jgi:hypothetical protein
MSIALRCLISLLLLPMAAWAAPEGQGLILKNDGAAWSTWQARLAVVSPAPLSPASWGPPVSTGAIRLSGDRYFNVWRLGDGGGLRATGALMLGQRSLAMSAPVTVGPEPWSWSPSQSPVGSEAEPGLTATPYVGLGYSAWWTRLGLGFSADLGLTAQRGGATGQVRWLTGGDSAEASGLRAVQVAPVLQLHLSYAF